VKLTIEHLFPLLVPPLFFLLLLPPYFFVRRPFFHSSCSFFDALSLFSLVSSFFGAFLSPAVAWKLGLTSCASSSKLRHRAPLRLASCSLLLLLLCVLVVAKTQPWQESVTVRAL